MPVPVVTPPITPRRLAKGVAIPTLSISASNTPTSYAATPLPAGLSINTSTGAITGTPTAAGLTTTEITATNGDGASAAVSLVWDIQDSPDGRGLWSDIELDLDVDSRTVTRPLVTTPDSGIVLRLLRRDTLSLLVGVKKFGVLRDVKPGSEVVSVKMALSEYADEGVLQLAGGTPTKVGSGATARFRINFEVTEAQWAILSDYEGERRTSIAALAEIELEVGDFRVASRPFRVEVVRDHFAPYVAPSPSPTSSPSPSPSAEYFAHVLAYDEATAAQACSNVAVETYYSSDETLTIGSVLFTTNPDTDPGAVPGPTGYYSDGTTAYTVTMSVVETITLLEACPVASPSVSPSLSPSVSPSTAPSLSPSLSPSTAPSVSPSTAPSVSPSTAPSVSPSYSYSPSTAPSLSPSASPSP